MVMKPSHRFHHEDSMKDDMILRLLEFKGNSLHTVAENPKFISYSQMVVKA